ncbi:hypothetical protein PAHAL_3G235600 [Panicum hallii]|uniref:Uncharacterized protein n=1 Tax=Panicum hallii TaxID=206008 RepID=A0A2S3HB35_9POAL|nr:hypothetical protein PAHAL_3G235600 [Panicum hallii]
MRHGGRIPDRSRFDKRIKSSEPARGGRVRVPRPCNRASRSGGWAAAHGGSQLLRVRPRRRGRISRRDRGITARSLRRSRRDGRRWCRAESQGGTALRFHVRAFGEVRFGQRHK